MEHSSVTEPGVQQIEVPASARAHSSLSRVDYADAFTVAVPDPGVWPAERWARLILLEAPLAVRTSLVAGWTAIGLELRRGAGTVLGWTVVESTPDVVLLGAGSRIGMPGQLRFERRTHDLLFCTFVAFESAAARVTWKGVEPTHVRVVPGLLADAHRRFTA